MSALGRLTATRSRRAALSSAAGLTARGITLFVTLATIPIALNYLGTERFGVWATLAAIISLLAFADLGIGNGLVNLLAG